MAYSNRHVTPDQRHPITGVKLNEISIKRKSLEFADAVTAWVMRIQGVTFTDIVQHLGTNPHRVGEVFRCETYPDAREEALRKLTG